MKPKGTAVLGLLFVLAASALVLAPLGSVARATPEAASAALFDEIPIVDDFNRPDENPLSDDNTWTTWGTGTPLKVVSNELACTTATGACHAWRKDSRYGIDHVAAVTIKTEPVDGGGWVRVYARLQFPSFADGYAVYYEPRAGNDLFAIEIVIGGGHTRLQTFSGEVDSGDKLAIQTDGSTISALQYDSGEGGWRIVGQKVDSTYLGVGFLGVGYVAVATTRAVARLDDFGALTLREAPADPNPRPLLDDFNRGDQNLSNDSRWTTWGQTSPLRVDSEELACTTSTGNCQSYWNDERFGLDQEAWVTFATKPTSWVRLYVRMQHPSHIDGYALYWEPRGDRDRVKFERVNNGVDSSGYIPLPEGSQQWFPAEFMHGDKLKVRAIGTRLEAWRYDNYAGVWSLLGHVNDSAYLGVGHVGVAIRYSVARLDDFGAATLREPTPYSDSVLDDFNRDDENPLSDGGHWTHWGGVKPSKTVSNEVACTSTTGGCQASWNAERFAVDQEAWVTFATKPTSWFRLYARLQQPTVINGYALYYEPRWGPDRVKFERLTQGSSPTVISPWFNVEFMHGDKLKIRAIGTTLEAWRYDNNRGRWTKLGEVSDSTYVRDGHIGVAVGFPVARLDDFGGGDVSTNPWTLLTRYAPELRFWNDEAYRADSAAIATDLYFDDSESPLASVLKNGDSEAVASADPTSELPTLSLRYLDDNQPESGYFLDQPNPDEPFDIPGAAALYSEWVARHPEHRSVIYGTVIPYPNDPSHKMLQYWLYCYYNPKQQLGIGKHESDWEWIQVHVGPDGLPVSLALSQHGEGQMCYWDSGVQVNTAGKPVVYVAKDSHANYFGPGSHTYDPFVEPDVTGDFGDAYRETPDVVDVTGAPSWIAWDGRWGGSGGFLESPRSPGAQGAWGSGVEEPPGAWWWWSRTTVVDCSSGSTYSPVHTGAKPETRRDLAATKQPALAQAKTSSRPQPRLPRIISARVVTGTRYGKAIRVSYCFASLPTNRFRRPFRLELAVENLRDNLPPVSAAWPVRRRCSTVVHPVGGIKAPYMLRYSVVSRGGTRSRQAAVRIPFS